MARHGDRQGLGLSHRETEPKQVPV
jgi:hypothetical protein